MNMDGGKFCVCLHTQKQYAVKYTAYPTGNLHKRWSLGGDSEYSLALPTMRVYENNVS
jgi:hypothetical protein